MSGSVCCHNPSPTVEEETQDEYITTIPDFPSKWMAIPLAIGAMVAPAMGAMAPPTGAPVL
ncbi:MAG: hypothetical protein R2867_16180 [Caldilineaceae bacterium]